jgi:hypothetical protein
MQMRNRGPALKLTTMVESRALMSQNGMGGDCRAGKIGLHRLVLEAAVGACTALGSIIP